MSPLLLGLRCGEFRGSSCFRGRCLHGVVGRSLGRAGFCNPSLEVVEFGVPDANDAKIFGPEGSEFCLESRETEFLFDEVGLQRDQFVALPLEFTLFGGSAPAKGGYPSRSPYVRRRVKASRTTPRPNPQT